VREAARFLDLDESVYDDVEIKPINASVKIRQRELHRAARWLGAKLPRGAATRALRAAYFWAQATRRTPTPSAADAQALDELAKHFVPFDEELGELLHIDVCARWHDSNAACRRDRTGGRGGVRPQEGRER